MPPAHKISPQKLVRPFKNKALKTKPREREKLAFTAGQCVSVKL